MITFWKIVGEAANGSSGGSDTVYAITDSRGHCPDPDKAITEVGARQYEWYDIQSIVRLGSIESVWNLDAEDCPDHARELSAWFGWKPDGYDYRKRHTPSRWSLWSITGVSRSDEDSSSMTVHVLYGDPVCPPCPVEALGQINPRRVWDSIDQIRCLGRLPFAWSESESAFDSLTSIAEKVS